jgi:hypothetical protein
MYQRGWLTLVLCMMVMPGVCALVSMTNPQTIYNLGDTLDLSATVSRPTAGTSFLEVVLVCGTNEATLYKAPLTVQANAQQIVPVSVPLTRSFIRGLEGSCALLTSYGDEETTSQTFTISTELLVSVPGALGMRAPGSTVTFNGTVVRRTGQTATGTVSYVSEGLGISGSAPVTNGIFSVTFSLPDDVRSQAYLLSVSASEGKGLNEGSTSTSIHMGQTLHTLEIAVNTPLLYPRDDIVYTVLASDQADESMYVVSDVSVLDATGTQVHRESLPTDTTSSYLLPQGSLPGIWTVRAEHNGTIATRQFSVGTVVNASVRVSNDTLTIVNTGNVPYNKTIEVSIGGVTESKQVALGVGEEKKFSLSGPDGEYIIEVNDGTQTTTGRSFLTGKSISVDDPDDQNLISRVSAAWILLILLLGVVAVYYYRKIGKPEFYGSAPSSSYSTRSAGGSFTFPEKKSQMIDRGERRPLPLLALRVKNHPANQGHVKEVVQKAIGEARAQGAVVQEQGSGTWVAFFTHKEGEDAVIMRAIHAAEAIQNALAEYNVKGNPQVDYGIGIHYGELIVEEQPFKYTALGNTVPLVKKLADYAPKGVLVSDEAHKYVASTTRCEKIHDRNAWKLKSISRRDRHNNFIKGFMKRQGFR